MADDNHDSLLNPPHVRMRVGMQNGLILLEFTESVTHVYMSPGEVSMLCKTLLEAQVKVIADSPRIIKPNG